jgi:hypothetical protein
MNSSSSFDSSRAAVAVACFAALSALDCGGQSERHAGASGGSASGGVNSAGGAETEGGEVNASGGRGGEASGGKSTTDGGAAGAPSAGGSTCVPPPAPKICSRDDECGAGEYCADACAASGCVCSNGTLVCTADCRNACVISDGCDSGTSAFVEQLTGEHCTVMVRYRGEQFALTGYAVDCGPVTPFSEQDALNRLLPMSSINWSSATSIGDAENTGVYAFRTLFSGRTFTAFISANTGRLLAISEVDEVGAGSFRTPPVWRDPAELGTYCGAYKSANGFFQIPVDDPMGPPFDAAGKLRGTGLLEALRAKFGHVGPSAIIRVGSTGSEALMLVNAP